MRTATANMIARLNTREGTAPLLVVKITWPSTGAVFYSEIPLTFGLVTCVDAIKTFSTLQGEVTVNNVGTYSGASITLLDDNDQTLKEVFDTNQAEGAAVEVYHWYSDLDASDAMLLLKGVVKSDIKYSDGERVLAFNIENVKEGVLLGYALEDEEDITSRDVSEEMVDQPWPLVFGTVLKSKALHLKKTLETTLSQTLDQDDNIYYFDAGYKFPQGEEITVEIEGIGFKGTLNGNAFTVTEKVVPIYEDLEIDSRPGGDPYVDSEFVFWLNEVADLKYKFVYLTHNISPYETMVNFCINQDSDTCFFRQPWTLNNNFILVDEDWTVTEVAMLPKSSWDSIWNYTINPSFDAPDLVTQYNLNRSNGGIVTYKALYAIHWKIEAGARVVLKSTETDAVYIANLIESDSVFEVFAYRTLNGLRIFAPVPSSYFTVKLADTDLLSGASNLPTSGNTVTTITFSTPLNKYFRENWEDDIYVSLKSTVDDNTADIIQWIVETYLTYLVDVTSFLAVHDSVQYCPMGFTINELKDAWAVCEELAWQARCAIWMNIGKVYLKYLSAVPSEFAKIFSNTDIELKTTGLSNVAAEDILTLIETTFKENYKPLEEWEEERLLTYRNPDTNYAENEETWDLYAFNIESLARLSLNFWGYRAIKQWRQVDFNSFLTNLRLEVFDFTQFSSMIFGKNVIPGYLLHSHFESDNSLTAFNMLLATVAGSLTYDENFWTGDQSYPTESPVWVGAGRQLVDYEPEEDEREPKVKINRESEKEPGDKFFLKISKWPELMVRGGANEYTLRIQVEDEYGNVCNISGICEITVTSSFAGDVFGPSGLLTVSLEHGFIDIDDFSVDSVPPGTDTEANGNITVKYIVDNELPDWIESIDDGSVSGIKIIGAFPVEFVDT